MNRATTSIRGLLTQLILGVFLLVIILPFQTEVNAGHGFDKTRITDNQLFTDTGSMSLADIQSFLVSNNSLLANWRDTVDMVKPDGCVAHKATNMTAAEIIHEASTAWGAQKVNDCAGTSIQYWDDLSGYTLQTISPKSLLVTLQKEQSLISATGSYSSTPSAYTNAPCCTSNEYKLKWAVGYAVPDSGDPNHKYMGFYNQINWAAWQLRFNYERSMGNTGWDEVGYLNYAGPMIAGTRKRCVSCTPQIFDGYYPIDGQSIYMSNSATASLYYYTPHTYPGYYGNYNYVQFYEQWFGPVFAGSYAYQHVSQTANPWMTQGFSNTVKIRLKNTGYDDWYDQSGVGDAPSGTLPVRLATDNPINRTSRFSSKWPTSNRAAMEFSNVYESNNSTKTSDQDKVEPGQIAEFLITFTAPSSLSPGTYKEYFTLVRDGSSGGKVEGSQMWVYAHVIEAEYKAGYIDQSSHPNIIDGDGENGYLQVRNIGNVDWFDFDSAPSGVQPVRLATAKPLNRNSGFSRLWPSSNRLSINFSRVYESNGTTLASDQHKVKPGQIAKFYYKIGAEQWVPDGKYRENIQLLREGTNNLFGPSMWIDVTYANGTYIPKHLSQSAYPTLSPGDTTTINFKFKNNGTAPWFDVSGAPPRVPPVRVGTTNLLNRASIFSQNWFGNNRPTKDFFAVYESNGTTLTSNQHAVYPGQVVEFRFDIKVPAGTSIGKYKEQFHLIKEGASQWQMDSPLVFWTVITVD